MQKLKFSLAALAVAAASVTTSVQAREIAEIYAECGIGGMVFPNDRVIAIISNFTWDLGSTALSSGLTTPNACNGGSARVAALILDAHPQLEQELAVGEGQYLASMVNMMGCGGREVEATMALRAQFADVVADGYFSADSMGRAEYLYSAAMATSASVCGV